MTCSIASHRAKFLTHIRTTYMILRTTSGGRRRFGGCGTLPFMPNQLPNEAMKAAEAAIVFAQQVRKHHRRRTEKKSEQRARDIETALERLQVAMKPLRSEIGRFPYGPQSDLAERNRQRIRDASQALQSERRKLWKMQRKEQ